MKTFIFNFGLAVAEQRCKVLSVSGGGSKGAYEVGVMSQMVEQLNEEYDVITGVSVGSINALGFGIFDYGNQKEMAEFMENQWRILTNDQIYKMWSKDPIKGITSEAGYFDNTPLLDYLLEMMNGKSVKKRVIVSANDANTGNYVHIPLHEIDPQDHLFVTSAVVGSASIPFFFPPRNMSQFGMDSLLIDGGTSWNNNMISGIEECLKLPHITSASQIDLDVITLDGKHLPPFTEGHMPSTIQFYERKKDIYSFYHDFNDMIVFMEAFPTVNYRYYFQPDYILLPGYEMLDFDTKNSEKFMELGKKDAKKVIEMGPGKSFDVLKHGFIEFQS